MPRSTGFARALAFAVGACSGAPQHSTTPPSAQVPKPSGLTPAAGPPAARARTVEDPDERAQAVESRMTDGERFQLLVSVMGPNTLYSQRDPRIPEDEPASAGYVPAIPRLGVPALKITDASLGITNPGYRKNDTATALPAALALAASFDVDLARRAGALLAREARVRGFNVVLGGGMNLVRDPRNGRNFEYLSEDPWLSAVIAAATVIGTQSQGVISMVKHFSLNANERNRRWLDAVIDPSAHRESDLLAFQIAIERAQPGSVMCGYNKVNGEYACGSDRLLNMLLKQAWGFKGWVMSDWGAVHDWSFALKGLDQESGAQIDAAMNGAEWFGGPLRAAYRDGKLPATRLSDMVRRVLRSMFAVGIEQERAQPIVDMAAHDQIALEVARRGIVLLKNDGALPIASELGGRVAVIGPFARTGVLAGAGSSAVTPPGGYAAAIPLGGEGGMARGRNVLLLPSAPFDELKKLLPNAKLTYDPGLYVSDAVALARRSDLAIVFAVRPESEGFDAPDLSLPWGQDALIDAVGAANKNTVVVLETGNPIAMPWQARAKAIVEAWFPGQAGGRAIAEVLTGGVNPSGRLPLTFPLDIGQTPRPNAPGIDSDWGTPLTVRYDEGADVGYRWFAKTHRKPLFAFGHGLSYTHFAYKDLRVDGGDTVRATFTVTNTGPRAGADVPQLYLVQAPGEARTRLLAFHRVELGPRESTSVAVEVDPRLLARFDGTRQQWRIDEGHYDIALSRSAEAPVTTATVVLASRLFGR